MKRDNFGLPDIDREEKRFQEILKGRVKTKDLIKYLSQQEAVRPGARGKDIKITIPDIQLPRFRYGGKGEGGGGGVGQGDGQKGDQVAPGPGQPGQGQPGQPGDGDQPGEGDEAGEGSGEHSLDLTLDDVVEMLGDQLELPNIQPKGKKNIESEDFELHGLRTTGPKALLSRRRTFREAYQRAVMSGQAKPGEPMDFHPIKKDKRYRSWKQEYKPQDAALIFFLRDYSGSMSEDKTRLLRTTDWILDLWLSKHYEGVERVYLVHDTEARVVEEEEYYGLSTGGGTQISSGYEKILELLEKEYSPAEYNIYLFQGTDGDNFQQDNQKSIELLEKLLPDINMVGLNQVQPKGTGFQTKYRGVLEQKYGTDHEIVRTSQTNSFEDIEKTIKGFLGEKGGKK